MKKEEQIELIKKTQEEINRLKDKFNISDSEINNYKEKEIPKKETKFKESEKEEIKEKYDIKYIITSSRKWFYITPITFLIVLLGALFLMFYLKVSMVLIIFYGILIFPISFLSIIYLLIRTFVYDWRRIKGYVILKLSKNYLLANFFTQNKKLIKVPVFLSSDGQSFKYEKGRYMVDNKLIWYDDDNKPNSLYMHNIPNPLNFKFSELYKRFAEQIIQQSKGENINDLVDISFSAEVLEKYKNDKIFAEFNRNPETEKFLLISFGLLGLSLLVIIIVILVK